MSKFEEENMKPGEALPLQKEGVGTEIGKGRQEVRSTLDENPAEDVESAFSLFVEKGPTQSQNQGKPTEVGIDEAFESIGLLLSGNQIERGIERMLMVIRNHPHKTAVIANKIEKILFDLKRGGHGEAYSMMVQKLGKAGFGKLIGQ